MEQNLIIHGVDDSIEVEDPKAETPMYAPKERCKHDVLLFFKDIMGVDISPEDVWKAHRTGQYKTGKVKPVIVKLSYPAKDLVMEHMSTLKGKKNPNTQQVYFISEQLPEGVIETRKQIASRIKKLKEINEAKPKENRSKIQVQNDQIIVDGELQMLPVQPPKPSELFPDTETQRQIDEIQEYMVETERFTVRSSEFTALAVKVHSLEQVNQAYIAAAQRYPSADHIMAAYAFKKDGKLYQGACDDKEFGAGQRIKNILFEHQAKNTALFVLRKYGGIHLGFGRFQAIEQVAKDALRLLQT